MKYFVLIVIVFLSAFMETLPGSGRLIGMPSRLLLHMTKKQPPQELLKLFPVQSAHMLVQPVKECSPC
jgi:hypothetical protein